MNVLMITTGGFPPDVRIEKEVRSLDAAGHTIHVACTSGDEKYRALWERAQIHRIDPPRPTNLLLRKANSAIWTTFFIDLFWLLRLLGIIRRNGIDLLHVHDLPLVRTARLVARLARRRVIADLHENYPDALEFYTPIESRTMFGKIRYSKRRWLRYERRDATRCDRVIAVSPEMKTRLIANEVPEEKIDVVENTVDLENGMAMSHRDIRDLEKTGNRFRICYAGTFGLHRGLDTAIAAMPRIRASIPTATLMLVGDGRNRPWLESLSSQLHLDGAVEFTGWVDRDQYNAFIRNSDVCLLPLLSNPHTEAGLPNKLFEYMSAGKPVVVSSCGGLSRVIRETSAGVEFEAGDESSLAEAVIELADEGLRRRLGDNGRAAVEDRFNWKESSKVLLNIYEELS